MINFNEPPYTGNELKYMKEAVENLKICGDGPFTKNVMHGLKTDLTHRRLCSLPAEHLH